MRRRRRRRRRLPRSRVEHGVGEGGPEARRAPQRTACAALRCSEFDFRAPRHRGVTRCPAQVLSQLFQRGTIAKRLSKRREMGSRGDFHREARRRFEGDSISFFLSAFPSLSRFYSPRRSSSSSTSRRAESKRFLTPRRRRANLNDCFGLSNVLHRTCSALCRASRRLLFVARAISSFTIARPRFAARNRD